MAATAERIILASASVARAELLRSAGIDFTIDPAAIDEAGLKREARRRGDSAIACARTLASEKACVISRRHPEALVIGGDQILAAGDEWFDKPADLAEADLQLRALRGRPHQLATAVCVAQGGEALWRATSIPELRMREFSEAFLAGYIAAEAEALLGSVGGYRLEGRGVQLFSGLSGDYFAVLGLPMIELLGFLRKRGVLVT